jgi:RNA polymerase sigma-70 factor, ECF subfamily
MVPGRAQVHDARVNAPEDRLEALYRADGDRLWRAVLAFTGDREVASDAVAEAFAQALRRGEAIRTPGPWVWRAAFKIAAGELKSRGRAGSPVPDVAYDPPEPAADLIEALAKLSPTQRGSLVLHHYAGYPVKEVATILGSTSAAVRVHLSQGRKRLRTLLETADE